MFSDTTIVSDLDRDCGKHHPACRGLVDYVNRTDHPIDQIMYKPKG